MSKTSEAPPSPRAGFSLIEMLIVLAIIVTLASMVLFGASALGIGSKKAKTGTILAAVRKGIELTVASKGGSISPVEHPFAGSKPPTGIAAFQFRGWRGRGIPPWSTAPLPGYNTTVTAGSPTLKGAEEWWIHTNTTNVFMDDDVFIDDRVPGLIGMPRGYMGVIGSQQYYVTAYQRILRPTDNTPITSVPPATLSNTVAFDVAQRQGLPQENQKAIDYLFGSSGVQSELSSLNALFETPTDPDYPAPNNDATLMLGKLVWSPDQSHTGWTGTGEMKADPRDRYDAGRATETAGSGPWLRYRLRGLGIYDAWGHEVFFSYGSGGGIRLLSLGADGCYKYAPGDDHTFESTAAVKTATDPGSVPVAASDKDGARDNVVQDVAE